jgi:hypothetical protein
VQVDEHTEAGVTYSIGEAAARTGLSRQGLLSWERRYGFPRPARNEKGHRRYSADDLVAIALARASVHSGRDVGSAVEEALSARTPASGLPTGLLRDVLDNLPFPLAIVQAPTFEHVYANLALVQAVPSVRLGSTVQSLPGVNDVSALERVARLGDPWHSQEQPIVIDGELRYFQVTWLRLASIDGRPPHLLGFGQETTEQARVRRRLRRSVAAEDDRRLVDEARHSRFLRSLVATVNAAGEPDGAVAALRTAVKRTCELLDADAAAVARLDGRAVVPTVSAVPTRGLRWRGFALDSAPQLERALERDALVWLQASRTTQRQERALLARLVARTLCAAPIVADGRPIGVLLVRWSLNEHQPSFDQVDFLELMRHLLAAPLARAVAGEDAAQADAP